MGLRHSQPSDESSVYAQDTSLEDLTLDEEEVSSIPAPSLMYDKNGDYHDIPNTYNSKPLFRKMYPDPNELRAARILQAHPHPNVVDIYHVCDEYIDMELLQTGDLPFNRQDLERAHAHLLKHNIVYMDWKLDNFGMDLHGITKVFDFDSSGIFDPVTDTWVYCPPTYYTMRKATEAGHIDPLDVDRFSFEQRQAIWGTIRCTE